MARCSIFSRPASATRIFGWPGGGGCISFRPASSFCSATLSRRRIFTGTARRKAFFQLAASFGLVLFYASFSKQLLHREASLKEEEVQWLRRILSVYQAFAALALLAGLVDYLFFDYAFRPFYIFPTYGGMAVLTYWLGMEGFARRIKAVPFHRRRKQEAPAPENEALGRRLKNSPLSFGWRSRPTLSSTSSTRNKASCPGRAGRHTALIRSAAQFKPGPEHSAARGSASCKASWPSTCRASGPTSAN